MEAYVGGMASGMRAQAVKYSADSMETFRKQVEGLIDQLQGSHAGAGKLKAENPVTRTQFGGGGAAWGEAESAFAAYDGTLSRLVELSGLLHDCLEGLGIAVVASKNGFEEMDDDIKRKMINIHQRTFDAKEKADKEAGRGAPASSGDKAAEDDSSFQ
ncbi:hypothetical protein H4W23_15660 [Streptomyces gardneri]|uniref:hypothetical protein n=1 Tax=Streptomyces gardneri TaxID=66892 RepID=UPI0006E3DE35|nr:hypothetical protein [Streptomyces gardneri]QPK45931.1 hypothetical protein H4W23_15660 [Streptomyces gardneri]WRK37283.1 hypothetical protein U0M97_15740 [Streptomyces venezuelae]